MNTNDLKIGYLVMHNGKRCSIEQITSAEYAAQNISADALVLGIQEECGRGKPIDFIGIRGDATDSITPIPINTESVIYVGLVKASLNNTVITQPETTIIETSYFKTIDNRITVVITRVNATHENIVADILYLDGASKRVQYLHELQQELINYYK